MKGTLIACFLLVAAVCGCGVRLQVRQEVGMVSADAATATAMPEPIPRFTTNYCTPVGESTYSHGYVYLLQDNQTGREYIVVTSNHGHAIIESKPK